MTRHWTSDLHIGHHNIIPFANRPFWKVDVVEMALGPAEVDNPDVDRMNQALLDNYNDRVRPTDEVWFIGDVVMGHFQTTIAFMHRFHGNKFLVPGNHDRCHKMFPKWAKFQPAYEAAGFTVLPSEVVTTVADKSVKVCHFPYWEPDHHGRPDRYSGNRPFDEGDWLIHGHTHRPEKVDRERRQIHVGVDAWDLCPVPESEIEKILLDDVPTQY